MIDIVLVVKIIAKVINPMEVQTGYHLFYPKIPPCPGKKFPVSFILAFLFKKEKNRHLIDM